MSNGGLSG